MKIVFVIEQISGIGGMERILIDKMNYLVEHTSHEVILLLVWSDRTPIAYTVDSRVRIERLNARYIPGIPFTKAVVLFKFNSAIRRINPDIVNYIWVMGAFLAAFTSWRGYSIFESHQPFDTMRHRAIVAKAARKVNTVVCLTNRDAEAFRKVGARHVEVIPNFTSIAPLHTPDYSQKNVVFVGRNSPEKDIPRLQQLWSQVQKKHADWTLSMHHNTENVVAAYLSGSILVMTSRMEGFGLVLVEGMRCGLPCVAFDCPYGPADIIEDGRTGYLIPSSDDAMFVEKLSLLMKDECLRARMGEEAKRTSSRFCPDLIMSRWQQLFNQKL